MASLGMKTALLSTVAILLDYLSLEWVVWSDIERVCGEWSRERIRERLKESDPAERGD